MDVYERKYGVLFEEFNNDKTVQTGYFGIIAFKKIIFGFTLVFLNNYPAINLTVFSLLNIIMLFIVLKYKVHTFIVHTIRDVISDLCFLIIFLASYPLLKNPTDE